MKILVSVINNITTDQRVEKVCNTLYQNGYSISLIGTNLYGLPPLKRAYKTSRFTLWFQKGFLLFAEFNTKLFFKLLKESDKKTILLANDMDSLLPNYLVSKIKNIPLVFDSHEIYSELPLAQGKLSQKVWRFLEKKLIPKIKYFYTVSEGYANFFDRKYANRPEIIYNVPYYYYNTPIKTEDDKIIIYQGVIKEGRGLSSLIQAMTYLPEYKLWIIGYGNYQRELEKLSANLNLKNISFLGIKFPKELKKITPQASIGVSLEENLGLSYFHALPNKLFDYVHSSIPIIGSYLPQIKDLIEKNSIGQCITQHNPKEIAQTIKSITEQGKEYYQGNLEKTARQYCWERQEATLLKIYSLASNSIK